MDKFVNSSLKGKKILFANFPADGHFNPLTGLAVHLTNIGCDVRWYSSKNYSSKLERLQIKHYPFRRALDVEENNFDSVFPERNKQKTQIGKLKFDIIHAFILRGPEYYADILEIRDEFPFDVMVADCAFTGVPFVKDLMQVPVISIGVLPLTETSKDLPPAGLGLEPMSGLVGSIKQSILRTMAKLLIFREPNKVMHRLFDEFKIPHQKQSVFDMLIDKSTLLLQSGTPGFEYKRSDLGKNIRFIGAVLPFSTGNMTTQCFDERLNRYEKIILVTQGTVEKDVEKLLVPTLEAFKNTDTLVICTTGGSKTEELRERFPFDNIIVKDFAPFEDIMPYADVFVTNGGYGGVMLGIENNLPLVVAGIHEGKNEINARVNYFKLGINLKTETPTPVQIKKAIDQVLSNPVYKINVRRIGNEFNRYDPLKLTERYLGEIITAKENNTKTTFLKLVASSNGEKVY